MVEPVIALLQKSETRTALEKCWEYVTFSAFVLVNGENPEFGNVHPEQAIGMALSEAGFPDEPIAIVQRLVLDQLQPPHIVSAHEVVDLLYSALPCHGDEWMDKGAFEAAYPAFLNAIRWMCRQRSESVAIAQIPYEPREDQERSEAVAIVFGAGHNAALNPDEGDSSGGGALEEAVKKLTENLIFFEIWSKNGVQVYVSNRQGTELDVRLKASKISGDQLMWATIWGNVSPAALESLACDVTPVVRSLVRCACVAIDPDVVSLTSRKQSLLPIANFEFVKLNRSFLKACLDSFFLPPKLKKDSLGRRIRNAVALVAEADQQRNHAVAIALSVTAIEALMGSGKSDIAKSVSERVAIVLEPSLPQRSHAEIFMKKAYDDRSRVLHGEEIEAVEGRRTQLREVAGAVLFAVVTYVEFLRKGGFDPQTPEEMTTRLAEHKYSSGQPLGIPQLPRVCAMWRKS